MTLTLCYWHGSCLNADWSMTRCRVCPCVNVANPVQQRLHRVDAMSTDDNRCSCTVDWHHLHTALIHGCWTHTNLLSKHTVSVTSVQTQIHAAKTNCVKSLEYTWYGVHTPLWITNSTVSKRLLRPRLWFQMTVSGQIKDSVQGLDTQSRTEWGPIKSSACSILFCSAHGTWFGLLWLFRPLEQRNINLPPYLLTYVKHKTTCPN